MMRMIPGWLMQRRILPTLILTALVTPVYAQDAVNPFATGIDRRMGQESYRVHCSLCHGYDAKGGGETAGPNLTTGRYRHATSVAGLFDVIRNGVDGTAMLGINPETPDRVVWQVITYLESLTPNPSDLELPGTPAVGRQLFVGRGNCARCHMVNGEGGRLGPDLSRVAERRDPDELRHDLVSPSADVDPRWWTVTVTRNDGSVVEGLRLSDDTFTLRLIDQRERLWSFSKHDLRSHEQVKTSTMPSVEDSLSAGEVDDLVAYLFSLRKES